MWLTKYRRLPRNVWALSLVSFLNDTSSEIIYPLLPVFLALTLGASPFAIGVIEGIAESAASLLKFFSGYLSDRFNSRKFPVFLGYSLASITRPLLAFAVSWPQVLFVRLTDRIGKGIRGAPRDALLAAEVPADQRGLAYGFNRAADHLGAVVGPVVASVLLWIYSENPQSPSVTDYQRVFLMASVPVVIGLFVIVFFVKEDPAVKFTPANSAPGLRVSIAQFDGNFRKFLAVIAVFTLSNSTDAFLLLRANEAGISTALIPLLWMGLHFSKVVSSLVGGNLSDRFGRKSLIFSGWILYAAVYVGFAFVTEAWQAWVLFLTYGVYFGLTESAEKALVADLVAPEHRGTAFGLYNLAFGITVFPASLLLGGIWSVWGSTYAFLFSAAVSVVAAFFLLTIRTERESG